jgi:SagB-type dehydrogenase family enzyme
VQHVEGVAPGIYHYNPQHHLLETMRDGDFSAFLAAHTFNQTFVEQAAVTLVLTGVYERLRWKYGERSYRYMCMDGGFLAQNLYLVGEALGLGVCAIAGFYDEDFEKLLQLNTVEEVVLLLLAVGVCDSDD